MYIYKHACTYTHVHKHIYISQHVNLSNINVFCPPHTSRHIETGRFLLVGVSRFLPIG